MKRSGFRYWAGLGAALVAPLSCASCAGAVRSSSEALVEIGTHRLEMRSEGKGSPVVVIDAGISDSLDKLTPLQERLAQQTRVITYNRAGYGRSEPGPMPRTAVREAEELKALLDKASVPGPYVLVGHSLGALNMQVFASRYPEDVAGIVLLDPPPLSFLLGQAYRDLRTMAERMTAEWQSVADSVANSPDARERAKSAFFNMIASEHREMFGESARTVGAITTFGGAPLVVMAAGKANPAFGEGAEAYQKYWVEQSRSLVKKAADGKFVLAEGASHYLYLDVPELVARQILSAVDEARARKTKSDEADARRLRCFEIVWRTIDERFFDPAFGGLDWNAVRVRYGPLIEAATSDSAFYERINAMVFELGVSHIGVLPPDEKDDLEPLASAEGGLGIDLRLLEGAAVITAVQPGSPGERAGLRPGDVLESIGGKTIAQWTGEVLPIPPLNERNARKRATSKVQEQLFGNPGVTADLVFRDGRGAKRETRAVMAPRDGRYVPPGGVLPPLFVEFESRRLEDVGYIRFNAFLPPVQDQFAEALRSLGDVRGLILDLRGNHGGMFPVRKSVVDRLVAAPGLLWRYKGRESIRDVLTAPADGAFGGPLVVLVDVMSASSAEEVSGGLQSLGRAIVIGERTAGVCLVMDAVMLPNGAVFVYPKEQTRTADGTVLEGRGVIPDIEVKLDRALLLRGIDSQLEAAVGYIKEKTS